MTWLAAGCRTVWVVDPWTRMISVYHPDSAARVLHETDTLTGGEVVPGFAIPVKQVFTLG
jgi:Uma2 family endonuclease